MSLDFNLSAIDDYKTLCLDEHGDMRPLTQALVFATLAVDIGVINAKTVDKFIERLRAVEMLSGGFLDGRGPITVEEVRAHMGLSTNVFPQASDAKFASRLGAQVLERARIALQREELDDAAG